MSPVAPAEIVAVVCPSLKLIVPVDQATVSASVALKTIVETEEDLPAPPSKSCNSS